jgi:hypothetical protein
VAGLSGQPLRLPYTKVEQRKSTLFHAVGDTRGAVQSTPDREILAKIAEKARKLQRLV